MDLEIRGLEYSRGGFRLDADLTLPSGEFGVVLGPSGCGKSTLLRIIAGLAEPESGQVLLGGRNMLVRPPEKRNMGFVFQDFALFPHLTARKNIEYGPKRHGMNSGERARICAELATAFHIEELLDRRPQNLSGGEQQRVALARALAVKPDLVLMDEPLSSLDEVLRKDLRRVIKDRLGSLGVTTLYVTHDTGEALAIADRLFVMKQGQVTHSGTPENLVSNPPDADFVRFMSLGPVIPVQSRPVEGQKSGGRVVCRSHAGRFTCIDPGSSSVVSVPLPASDPAKKLQGENTVLYFPSWAPRLVSSGESAEPAPILFADSSENPTNTFCARIFASNLEGKTRRMQIQIQHDTDCALAGDDPDSESWRRTEIQIDANSAPRPGDFARFYVPPEDCLLIPATGSKK